MKQVYHQLFPLLISLIITMFCYDLIYYVLLCFTMMYYDMFYYDLLCYIVLLLYYIVGNWFSMSYESGNTPALN